MGVWGNHFVIRLFVQLLITLFTLTSLAQQQSSVEGVITFDQGVLHLELSGLEKWDYRIEKQGKQVHLFVPALTQKTIVQLKAWKGSGISKTEVETGENGGNRVVFTLSDPNLDVFDYLTEQPSKLMIDFFKKTEDAVVKTASEKNSGAKKSVGTKKSAALKSAGRKPASDEFLKVEAVAPGLELSDVLKISDGNDPELKRFAVEDYEIDPKAQIKSRQNIYLRFPMLVLEQPYLKELWDNPTEYEVAASDDVENQEARLLLSLATKKKHASFLKTLQLHREKFPKSNYEELLTLLEADVSYDLWKKNGQASDFESAMGRYRQYLERYPQSKAAERIGLLIGYSYLKEGQAIGVLSNFQRFLRIFPETKFKGAVQIAIAQAYLDLNKFEDARNVLRTLEDDTKAEEHRQEATVRLGDTYFAERNYKLAIQNYERAEDKYKGSRKKFPNIAYNQAEALFWLGKYRESLDQYRDFLKNFAVNPNGAYAMTRIGEILEILGVKQQKIAGAYFESIFRYQNSPGAMIAKIRLVSERMKDMKPKEIEKNEAEIKAFATTSTIPRVRDFATILSSDGYFARKEFDKAFGKLVAFYQENPTSPNLDIFRSRIVRNFTEQIRGKVDEGNFIKALEIYGQNAGSWLKDHHRIDLRYDLGRSFEKAGVPEESIKLYQGALNQMIAIRGTPEEQERNVFEKLAGIDEVRLRLAAVSTAAEEYGRAYDYLKEIQNPEKTLNESEQIEHVRLMAKLLDKKGEIKKSQEALAQLIQVWKGKPNELSQVYIDLAKSYAKENEHENVLKTIQPIFELQESLKNISSDVIYEAMVLKSKSYLGLKKHAETIAAFEKLLEGFEESKSLSEERFQLGKLYFENGDLKKAEETWEVLNRPKDMFWYQLAQEQLKQMKWDNDFKKYIKRMPAMNDFQEDSSK